MPPLNIEVHNATTDEWVLAGQLSTADRNGTISDNHALGRDIYQFGIDPVENQGYIKRSQFGVDSATPTERVIDSAGFILIATLGDQESYEMTIKTDVSTEPRKIRFTYIAD